MEEMARVRPLGWEALRWQQLLGWLAAAYSEVIMGGETDDKGAARRIVSVGCSSTGCAGGL